MTNITGRRRRVKCGEEKQTCDKCKKSGFVCVWPNCDSGQRDDGTVRKSTVQNGKDFVFYNPTVKAFVPKATESSPCAEDSPKYTSPIDMDSDTINLDWSRQPLSERLSPDYSLPKVDSFVFRLGMFFGSDSSKTTPKSPTLVDNDESYSISPKCQEALITSDDLEQEEKHLKYIPSESLEPMDSLCSSESEITETDVGLESHDIIQIHELLDDGTEALVPRAQTHALSLNLLNQMFFQTQDWFPPGRAKLMYAFINGFVEAISPQFCHPKLTPGAIFIAQGSNNAIMQEVFLACGAAFMSNIDAVYAADSRKEYSLCLTNIADEFSQTKESKEWMVAAMLLFCLRDKIVGAPPLQAAMHLAKAIDLLRDLLKGQNYDIQNLKFMAESFLFNYAVLLLVGGKEAMEILPSPFVIFEEWRRLIEMQIYQGSVPWMNNPVFGAAGRGFELAAKVSTLVSKHPLNTADAALACDLLLEAAQIDKFANFEPPVTLSRANRQHLKDSVNTSNTIVTCCKIVLYKLLNPSIGVNNPSIQKLTLEAHGYLDTILAQSRINVIISWGTLVLGLCTTDPKQRFALLTRCAISSTTHHVAFLGQLGNFLEKIWGCAHSKENGDIDYLFEPDILGSMCL